MEQQRKREYEKWLDDRKRIAYEFAVPVDNSRDNIIKMAMIDLIKNNRILAYKVILKNKEAALWMIDHSLEIESISNQIVKDLLNDTLRSVISKPDGVPSSAIEKMEALSDALNKSPAAASIPAAVPGGSRRRNKKSKNSKKKSRKSRKTKSRRH